MAPRGMSKYLLPAAVLLSVGIGLLVISLPDEEAPSVTSTATTPSIAPGGPEEATPSLPVLADSSADQIDQADAVDPEAFEPNDPWISQADASESDVLPTEAPAEALPDPGYIIRGTVVSPKGFIRDEPDQWPRTFVALVRAPGYARDCRLDEAGRFECTGLDAGVYVVSVGSLPPPEGLLCESVQVALGPDSPVAEPVLVLGAEQVPVGVLVLAKGSLQPQPDRMVLARSVNGLDEVTVPTDDRGCCVLNLIPGRYWIDAPQRTNGPRLDVDPHLVAVEPAARNLTVQVLVPAPEATMIRIVLVDPQGHPAPGYVHFDSAGAQADLGAEPASSFCFRESLLPGLSGGYARDVSGLLASRFLWPAWTESMTIVLEPRAKVAGRVIGVDGLALPDARIHLQIPLADNRWRAVNDSFCTLAVDAGGGFQFDGVALGPALRIAAYRGLLRGQSDLLDLKAGKTLHVGDIVLRAPERVVSQGVVGGRIIDEKGLPVPDGAIGVRLGDAGSKVPVRQGYFVVSEVPTDGPVMVTVDVPGYGTWSRTTVAGDSTCDFQVYPQGWGLVGEKAPPLLVDRWINHAPMTWEALRGRLVLLMFRDLNRDSFESHDLRTLLSWYREYQARGLVAIAVYRHIPEDGAINREGAVRHILDLLQGASIAGCLDADPNLAADPARESGPTDGFAGATHSLYRVYSSPAMVLVDEQGRVRCCVGPAGLRERIDALLKN